MGPGVVVRKVVVMVPGIVVGLGDIVGRIDTWKGSYNWNLGFGLCCTSVAGVPQGVVLGPDASGTYETHCVKCQ